MIHEKWIIITYTYKCMVFVVPLTPGTKPALPELLQFRCKDRKVVNIPVEIATNYTQFGTILLDDRTGSKVKSLEHEHHKNSAQINTEILRQWLNGSGKKPVTWKILVGVLRDIELSTLADNIEAIKCQV